MTGVKVKSSLDVYHLTQKFNPKVVKISSYLSLFERQVKRAKVPEELWVSHLIGLLPNDMAQLIDKEPEEVAEDCEEKKTDFVNTVQTSSQNV
ncbi:hypothetical protein AVEN_35113-1 [Araneus ventricosus]|uniref:Uncharacterized protein n=1 Tax=Araneus ventricosus TaxID=182803 RepID=A0A4Y2MQ81_ARAVE|nr:hypothetical protein AVEN_35113-1 [Araneus ventricosus]